MEPKHEVVSKEQWIERRKALLREEKEFTKLRDRLSEERRRLPWVEVEQSYVFDGPRGPETLLDLFAGRTQLVVYHFMFAPESKEGCKSCSFWADHFERSVLHLEHRDVSFAAISRAPVERLRAFASRFGWTFKWVSSGQNRFNYDFVVSFSDAELATGTVAYNYGSHKAYTPDMPGVSVFVREGDRIWHTYSCYSRGIDMLNGTYQVLDLVPKGRDEGDRPMSWLRLRDRYET